MEKYNYTEYRYIVTYGSKSELERDKRSFLDEEGAVKFLTEKRKTGEYASLFLLTTSVKTEEILI